MPIVINEIEISMEVATGNNTPGNTAVGNDALQRQEIIKECVEKIMEIINQKNER